MFWLGKVFRLREKVLKKRSVMSYDDEKPFLDHLEDLRQTLTRMIITIVVSMILCFAFDEQLFSLIQGPLKSAHVDWPDQEKLPPGLEQEEWPTVRAAAHGVNRLNGGQRHIFLEHLLGSKEEATRLMPHVQALMLYNAALDLPEAQRLDFVQKGAALARPDFSEPKAEGGAGPADPGFIDAVKASAEAMVKNKLQANLDLGAKAIATTTFSVAEGFNMSMKLSFFAGIVVAFPLLLYYLLQFVLPGLKPEEKRILWPSLGVGFGLFLFGVSFCYFYVAPSAIKFFHDYSVERNLDVQLRLSDYVSFATQFILIFGLCFELPVVVYALIKLGMIGFSTMNRTRAYAVLIIVVVAAVITPTGDALTLGMLAVPMIVLYEICIWLAWFEERKNRKIEEQEAAERKAWRERANLVPAYDSTAAPAAEHPADDPAYTPLPHDPAHDDRHRGTQDAYHDAHHGYHDDAHHGSFDTHRDDPAHYPQEPPFGPESNDLSHLDPTHGVSDGEAGEPLSAEGAGGEVSPADPAGEDANPTAPPEKKASHDPPSERHW